jgi:hypothetical protein
MKTLGLVVSRREGKAEVFRANDSSPLAPLLRGLVKESARRVPPADEASQRTRGELRALGAPLRSEPVSPVEAEETVVRGVQLAHRDPTVARVLPVCLYRSRETLRMEVLERHARDLCEKRALGFFLDLTAQLSGDRRFGQWAKHLRDGRYGAEQDFFASAGRSRSERRLAARNTPTPARRWRLRLGMGLDAFASTFEKFANAS